MKLYHWALRRAALLVIVVFVLNFAGDVFGVYYTIWWWDVMTHFLGGVSIGLLTIAFLSRYIGEAKHYWYWWLIICTSVFVGWEVCGALFYSVLPLHAIPGPIDTGHDLINDYFGALIAYQWTRQFYSGRLQ